MSWTRLIGTIALTLTLAGCGGSDAPGPATTSPGDVVELTRLETLKAAFADDEGKARLLILLSPT